MSALRSKLIRLAHTNPELRPHLLPLLHTAGNLGEDLNPYFLDPSQGDIDGANRDLKKIVAATSRTVGTLVSKALRESGKFGGLFSDLSEEEFRDDLVAMVISAVHNAK